MPEQDVGQLTNHQRLLMEVRDKLCDGNAAELARRIEKDATYVNRLFYPKDKAGHKGIGLAIMSAANRAFHLPVGFWDREPPGLDADDVKRSRYYMALGTGVPRRDDPIPIQIERTHAAIASESDPEEIAKLHHHFLAQLEAVRAHEAAIENDRLRANTRHRLEELRALHRMMPILAWEHPDELPEGEFVMIPRLDVHLSAGGGRDQVELQLVKENPQAFRSEWIRLMRLKPGKLAAMRASGESMEPTIHDGDSLLVDTSQTDVADGKVYALWYDGGERVKRLFRLPGGGLRIHSDNKDMYPDITLRPDELEHVRVIGRIVHRSGTGGL